MHATLEAMALVNMCIDICWRIGEH
jgi:hypothetical protein